MKVREKIALIAVHLVLVRGVITVSQPRQLQGSLGKPTLRPSGNPAGEVRFQHFLFLFFGESARRRWNPW